MQRVIASVLLVIVLMLVGCSQDGVSLTSSPISRSNGVSLTNSPEDGDSLTICKMEKKSGAAEAEVTRRMTMYVYHKGSYVAETVFIEENELINGSILDLVVYEQAIEEMFNSDKFQVEGFSYSTELKDTTFILTTTYDYTNMNVKEELERGKELYHVKGLVDENYKVPYDNFIKRYTDMGFTCEEESSMYN